MQPTHNNINNNDKLPPQFNPIPFQPSTLTTPIPIQPIEFDDLIEVNQFVSQLIPVWNEQLQLQYQQEQAHLKPIYVSPISFPTTQIPSQRGRKSASDTQSLLNPTPNDKTTLDKNNKNISQQPPSTTPPTTNFIQITTNHQKPSFGGGQTRQRAEPKIKSIKRGKKNKGDGDDDSDDDDYGNNNKGIKYSMNPNAYVLQNNGPEDLGLPNWSTPIPIPTNFDTEILQSNNSSLNSNNNNNNQQQQLQQQHHTNQSYLFPISFNPTTIHTNSQSITPDQYSFYNLTPDQQQTILHIWELFQRFGRPSSFPYNHVISPESMTIQQITEAILLPYRTITSEVICTTLVKIITLCPGFKFRHEFRDGYISFANRIMDTLCLAPREFNTNCITFIPKDEKNIYLEHIHNNNNDNGNNEDNGNDINGNNNHNNTKSTTNTTTTTTTTTTMNAKSIITPFNPTTLLSTSSLQSINATPSHYPHIPTPKSTSTTTRSSTKPSTITQQQLPPTLISQNDSYTTFLVHPQPSVLPLPHMLTITDPHSYARLPYLSAQIPTFPTTTTNPTYYTPPTSTIYTPIPQTTKNQSSINQSQIFKYPTNDDIQRISQHRYFYSGNYAAPSTTLPMQLLFTSNIPAYVFPTAFTPLKRDFGIDNDDDDENDLDEDGNKKNSSHVRNKKLSIVGGSPTNISHSVSFLTWEESIRRKISLLRAFKISNTSRARVGHESERNLYLWRVRNNQYRLDLSFDITAALKLYMNSTSQSGFFSLSIERRFDLLRIMFEWAISSKLIRSIVDGWADCHEYTRRMSYQSRTNSHNAIRLMKEVIKDGGIDGTYQTLRATTQYYQNTILEHQIQHLKHQLLFLQGDVNYQLHPPKIIQNKIDTIQAQIQDAQNAMVSIHQSFTSQPLFSTLAQYIGGDGPQLIELLQSKFPHLYQYDQIQPEYTIVIPETTKKGQNRAKSKSAKNKKMGDNDDNNNNNGQDGNDGGMNDQEQNDMDNTTTTTTTTTTSSTSKSNYTVVPRDVTTALIATIEARDHIISAKWNLLANRLIVDMPVRAACLGYDRFFNQYWLLGGSVGYICVKKNVLGLHYRSEEKTSIIEQRTTLVQSAQNDPELEGQLPPPLTSIFNEKRTSWDQLSILVGKNETMLFSEIKQYKEMVDMNADVKVYDPKRIFTIDGQKYTIHQLYDFVMNLFEPDAIWEENNNNNTNNTTNNTTQPTTTTTMGDNDDNTSTTTTTTTTTTQQQPPQPQQQQQQPHTFSTNKLSPIDFTVLSPNSWLLYTNMNDITNLIMWLNEDGVRERNILTTLTTWCSALFDYRQIPRPNMKQRQTPINVRDYYPDYDSLGQKEAFKVDMEFTGIVIDESTKGDHSVNKELLLEMLRIIYTVPHSQTIDDLSIKNEQIKKGDKMNKNNTTTTTTTTQSMNDVTTTNNNNDDVTITQLDTNDVIELKTLIAQPNKVGDVAKSTVLPLEVAIGKYVHLDICHRVELKQEHEENQKVEDEYNLSLYQTTMKNYTNHVKLNDITTTTGTNMGDIDNGNQMVSTDQTTTQTNEINSIGQMDQTMVQNDINQQQQSTTTTMTDTISITTNDGTQLTKINQFGSQGLDSVTQLKNLLPSNKQPHYHFVTENTYLDAALADVQKEKEKELNNTTTTPTTSTTSTTSTTIINPLLPTETTPITLDIPYSSTIPSIHEQYYNTSSTIIQTNGVIDYYPSPYNINQIHSDQLTCDPTLHPNTTICSISKELFTLPFVKPSLLNSFNNKDIRYNPHQQQVLLKYKPNQGTLVENTIPIIPIIRYHELQQLQLTSSPTLSQLLAVIQSQLKANMALEDDGDTYESVRCAKCMQVFSCGTDIHCCYCHKNFPLVPPNLKNIVMKQQQLYDGNNNSNNINNNGNNNGGIINEKVSGHGGVGHSNYHHSLTGIEIFNNHYYTCVDSFSKKALEEKQRIEREELRLKRREEREMDRAQRREERAKQLAMKKKQPVEKKRTYNKKNKNQIDTVEYDSNSNNINDTTTTTTNTSLQQDDNDNSEQDDDNDDNKIKNGQLHEEIVGPVNMDEKTVKYDDIERYEESLAYRTIIAGQDENNYIQKEYTLDNYPIELRLIKALLHDIFYAIPYEALNRDTYRNSYTELLFACNFNDFPKIISRVYTSLNRKWVRASPVEISHYMRAVSPTECRTYSQLLTLVLDLDKTIIYTQTELSLLQQHSQSTRNTAGGTVANRNKKKASKEWEGEDDDDRIQSKHVVISDEEEFLLSESELIQQQEPKKPRQPKAPINRARSLVSKRQKDEQLLLELQAWEKQQRGELDENVVTTTGRSGRVRKQIKIVLSSSTESEGELIEQQEQYQQDGDNNNNNDDDGNNTNTTIGRRNNRRGSTTTTTTNKKRNNDSSSDAEISLSDNDSALDNDDSDDDIELSSRGKLLKRDLERIERKKLKELKRQQKAIEREQKRLEREAKALQRKLEHEAKMAEKREKVLSKPPKQRQQRDHNSDDDNEDDYNSDDNDNDNDDGIQPNQDGGDEQYVQLPNKRGGNRRSTHSTTTPTRSSARQRGSNPNNNNTITNNDDIGNNNTNNGFGTDYIASQDLFDPTDDDSNNNHNKKRPLPPLNNHSNTTAATTSTTDLNITEQQPQQPQQEQPTLLSNLPVNDGFNQQQQQEQQQHDNNSNMNDNINQ